MNEVREIVTRAVIAKGKKTIRCTDTLTPNSEPYSILGCWIINHEYTAELKDECVEINGCYEVNIWYAYDANTRTDVAREQYDYSKKIRTKQVVRDACKGNRDVLITTLQQPTCINANITENRISVDVCFELLAEIIGETKVKVAILDSPECFDYEDDDFEDEINENFINEG